MLFVFTTAPSSRPEKDANTIADALGMTAYELRLALAAGAPSVLLATEDAARASAFVGLLRTHGLQAQVFDDVALVPSQDMTRFDRFVFEVDGVRREADDEVLGYGDVFAVLRAVHELVTAVTDAPAALPTYERENVAYFFRRSGARPWLLRERHASYLGLGADLGPAAFGNFRTTVAQFTRNAPMAVSDDRLLRRRVVNRLVSFETLTRGAQHSSQAGVDLLAHLLAATIASQGGSPYR